MNPATSKTELPASAKHRQAMIGGSDMNQHNNCLRTLCLFSPLLLVVWLLAGCATANVKPAYPALEAAAAASTLKFDNTISTASIFKAPIGVTATVDGFLPTEKKNLKGKQTLPKGITEVRLSPGSHTLVYTGVMLGGGVYYFNPVSMAFDTEEGKTYVIRFKLTSSFVKPSFAVEYEGWSTEQASQWPNEVRIANPMFGH